MLKIRHIFHHVAAGRFKNPSSKIAANWYYYVNIHIDSKVFEEIPQRRISSLNSLLTSYTRNGEPIEAWKLFLQMHCIRSDLDSYTFTPVLTACAALADPALGTQAHALMVKLSLDSEIVIKTALIDMYSKCDQIENSVRVFGEMGSKDVVAWNAMLSTYLRHGCPLKAIDLLKCMRRERVDFSEFTLCSTLTACSSLNAYKQGKQIHGLIIVMGRDMVVLSTALVVFYSNLGQIDEAMKVYHNLSWKKDDIMYNALIASCVHNKRYDVALSITSEVGPNVNALTCAVSACSENSDIWIGKQIHGLVIRQDFAQDTQLCNALLDMYAKSGKLKDANLVFDSMGRKDVVSWTSLIDAYGCHGCGTEALDLFKRMVEKEKDVVPNSVTLLAVLSACGHSGLVGQGRRCFNMVQEKYGLVPGPEHYACLIDMLGRAGDIEEVWCLFNELVEKGANVSAAVWATLLNACIINQDAIRGEFAAKNLLELEPDNPANYVTVSNFFAAIGRWDSVDKWRSIMKEKGMSKGEGRSLVSVARFSDKLHLKSSELISGIHEACGIMPKEKTSLVNYLRGCDLLNPALHELQSKTIQAVHPHDTKGKVRLCDIFLE